jgi:integrase
VAADASCDQAAKSYRLLHAMLTTAVSDDLVRVNPCGVRGGGQEHAGERPMIPTSLALELGETIDARYRALVLLAGFASLRTGESLGLRRLDVDLLHAEVHVRVQAQQVTGKGRVVKEPKSEAGVRSVILPTVVIQALDHHLAVYTRPDRRDWCSPARVASRPVRRVFRTLGGSPVGPVEHRLG